MDQEKTVNAILRDLKMIGLIEEESTGEFRPYLMALWTAGWEEGILNVSQHASRPVGQYNLEGKLLNTFRSVKKAAEVTHFSTRGIFEALQRGTPTRQGWFWRYLTGKNKRTPAGGEPIPEFTP